MTKADTKFSSTNQPKGRGKAKKSLMLEAIRSVCGSEQEFLNQVIKVGLGDAVNEVAPNPTLLTLVLNRIEPPLKAIAPMVEFEFNSDAKPHEQANQILNAVANSQIAPDIGQMFIASIKSMIDISEWTDLKERIESLEAALRGEE
ncbi:MAG TPA: hypothetical protein EYN54_13920 [Methylococcaceae bacterium]|nr:hypothetical protein [Methylococcaceae bacterium]